jgi:hypothetical protein
MYFMYILYICMCVYICVCVYVCMHVCVYKLFFENSLKDVYFTFGRPWCQSPTTGGGGRKESQGRQTPHMNMNFAPRQSSKEL